MSSYILLPLKCGFVEKLLPKSGFLKSIFDHLPGIPLAAKQAEPPKTAAKTTTWEMLCGDL